MDDLDRLYDRLIANIDGGFPHLAERAFQLGDISEHLVPYRLNRREIGLDSVRQYELALMRLASGERGYLRAETAVQDAFRRALTAPEPDATLLRDHARASVALASPGSVERAPMAAAAAAPIEEAEPAASTPASPAPEVLDPLPSSALGTPVWGTETTPPTPVGTTASPTPSPVPAPPRDRWVGAAGPAPRPGPTVMGGPCRYCGNELPEGRPVTFCPSCGQNVTVRLCPACSTELEVGWRFCITCGRAMDESALAAPER